jgi:tripartite-type tricarboxylate transporter receptor subunit TctC
MPNVDTGKGNLYYEVVDLVAPWETRRETIIFHHGIGAICEMVAGNQYRRSESGMKTLPRCIALAAAFAGSAVMAQAPSTGTAPAWPSKPIRLVVGFPPGGATDIVARTFSQKLAEFLGQPLIIDNRPGAGGVPATEHVAKTPPDGYTLLLGTIGGLAVAMSLIPNRGYDTLRDFAPVTQPVSYTTILVVHPSLPPTSVKELLAFARTRPGMLNHASSGNGTITHLAAELFKYMGHVNMVHVPYKGNAPAMTALLSGEVHLNFENSLLVLPHVKSGKVRALGVTGAQRSRSVPELPTISEAGLPGYAATGWNAFVVPAAVPKDIVTRLATEINRALRLPEVVERLSSQGAEPLGGTPEQLGAFMRVEIDKWAILVKAANMKAD